MQFKALSLAAGILLLSAGAASAAVVTRDLNLRSGPGTRYAVIDTMPGGAHVDVLGCAGAWCRVDWRGRVGFASAHYLAGEGATYIAPPRVYYGPWPYYDGWGPVFGFGWGGGWRGGHVWHGGRGGWHGGYRGHGGSRG